MRRYHCWGCSRRGRPTVGVCADCRRTFCDRHGGWADGRWLCKPCVPEGVEMLRADGRR